MQLFDRSTWTRAIKRGLLAAVPACLIVGAVVGLFAFLLEIHARKVVPRRAAETLQAQLDTATERLNNNLEPLQAQLYVMRDWFRSGSVSPKDTDELNQLCLPLLKRWPWLDTLRVASSDGTEWMLDREETGWLSRNIRVIDDIRLSTWTRWDGDGAPTAREERGATTYDPRDTTWYRGAIAELSVWQNDATLSEPPLYWHTPDWSASPDELKFILSLGLGDENNETVLCFELSPSPLLRTDCLSITSDGTVLTSPEDLSDIDLKAAVALCTDSTTTHSPTQLDQAVDTTLWTQSVRYSLAPNTVITLAAVAREPELRAIESGLQRAALSLTPIAMLVMTLLFYGAERFTPENRKQRPAVSGPGDYPALAEPPQAYLQALDSARKQARRLQAALEAEHHSRDLANTHWRDAMTRTQTSNKTLFDLLSSDSLWQNQDETPFEVFANAAVQSLVLDTCSIWRLKDGADSLKCIAMSKQNSSEASPLPVINRKEFPLLFLAIEMEPYIAASDAGTDPRLEGLSHNGVSYKEAHTSLLFVPILLGSHYYGALCFERSSRWRKWEADEIAFAQGLAHLLAFRFRLADGNL